MLSIPCPHVIRDFEGNKGVSRGLCRKRSLVHVEDSRRVGPIVDEQLRHH